MKTRIRTRRHYKLVFALLSSISLLFARSDEPDRPIEPVLHQLETFIKDGMGKTGVPGVAVSFSYIGRLCRFRASAFLVSVDKAAGHTVKETLVAGI
jgi:hypothetical protein